MSEAAPQPHAAYYEEFNEDAQTTVPETRQSANIAAKRSKPDALRPKAIRDELSDSGYSSHTNGTPESSLDSKIEAAPVGGDPNAPSSTETPTRDGEAHPSRPPSPEKVTLRRTKSKSRRDEGPRRKEQGCNCAQCDAKARRSAVHLGTEGHMNEGLPHAWHRTSPPVIPKPPRTPLVQPVQAAPPLREHSRPRASTSHARPMSFHDGMMPDPVLMPQPIRLIERQPLSRHATVYPVPPPSYPPLQPFLPPGHRMAPPQEFFAPMPAVYEIQPRPRPRQWMSDQRRPRPQSMSFGNPPPPPPFVEYAEPIYQTIQPSPRPQERQIHRRQRPRSPPGERSTRGEDYRAMPPPPPPPPRVESKSRQEQRPTMKHTTSKSGAYPSLNHRRSGHDAIEGHSSHHGSRKPSTGTENSSRRPSLARPSRTSDEKAVSFDSIERGMGRVDIEAGSTKSHRRASVYTRERLNELEGSIEDYQASRGSPRSPTYTPSPDDLMRVVRKTTNTSSDAGSRASGHSRSSRDGSDVKPRSSTDRRPSTDLKARNENDKFALRFNPQGINVSMQGGIEGRTINLKQSKEKEGEMRLSIGSRGRAIGSRPTIREKSRKRYSVVEGQGVSELEPSSPRSRARTVGTESRSRRHSNTRPESRARPEIRGEDGPRIVGERITTTMRSRRSSRYGYDGRVQFD